jgi:uncharacterized membrane protein
MLTDDTLAKNIEAVKKMEAEYEAALPQHYKLLDRFVAWFRTPAFLYSQVIFFTLWIVLDRINSVLHLKWNVLHLNLMEQGISIASLLISTGVLIHESVGDRLNTQKTQLLLQLTLAAEQKSTKAIQLLEELRRDLPNVQNRIDHEAEHMQDAVTPDLVLEKLSESENAVEGSNSPIKSL